MTTYRVWRTATITQFKDVLAPQGATDDDIWNVADGTPWKDFRMHAVQDYSVEELD